MYLITLKMWDLVTQVMWDLLYYVLDYPNSVRFIMYAPDYPSNILCDIFMHFIVTFTLSLLPAVLDVD